MATQRTKDKKAYEAYKARLEAAKNGSQFNPDDTPEEKRAIIERCKKDVKFFAQTFYPHYCTSESADFQVFFANKIAREPEIKIFAQWGRALAKSVWADIIVPSWLWLRGEAVYMVIVGDSADKAKELLAGLQAEFEADTFTHFFGPQKLLGSWEDGNFTTTGGFTARALGFGKNVRGLRKGALRPNYIVCDDIETSDINVNPKRQDKLAKWVKSSLIPTMDGDKNTNIQRFVYANNRFAPRMIQTVLQAEHPKWYVHQVNAYDPVTYKPTWHQKYPDDYFKKKESADDGIGVLACKAEYNNDPHIEGKIFLHEQIQWTKLPRIDHFEIIVGHWDVAYAGTPSADYNAVRLWGLYKRRFYLIDCYVKQSKMDGAIHWMCDKQQEIEDRCTKGIYIQWQYESQFWNDEVQRTIDEVKAQYPIHLNLIQVDRPTSNKYLRILSTHVYYQNSKVYYNIDLKSHNDTLEGNAQLLGIEPGYKGHDDSPDADEAAFRRLSEEIVTGDAPEPVYGDEYENTSF